MRTPETKYDYLRAQLIEMVTRAADHKDDCARHRFPSRHGMCDCPVNEEVLAQLVSDRIWHLIYGD
jgi:hypothetical protein